MAKVWEKNQETSLNPIVEKYEVGSDYILDGKLLKYELASSIAHAMMLRKIGVLNSAEFNSLSQELKKIYDRYGEEIKLEISDEDIHSKVENILIEKLGDTGKKLHTGRSRNDQILVVLRLYEKEQIQLIMDRYINLMLKWVEHIRENGEKIIPGYTHTKQALLINVKAWLSAFIESGIDNIVFLKSVYDLVDSNPLGSGSGFGVPLPLDREMTAELLGFFRIQYNPVYVQNSRGKFEGLILDAIWAIMNDFSRLASDLLLFNMDELLFVKTNSSITTGSSIMPQKRNFDVVELIRARSNVLLSYSFCVKTVVNGLISGYNRDIQETKEPLMKSFDILKDTISVLEVVFDNIEWDEEAVKNRLSKGIFATDLAFDSVKSGKPFREAYKEASLRMKKISIDDKTIGDSLKKRISPGAPVTIKPSLYLDTLKKEQKNCRANLNRLNKLLGKLLKW